MILGCGYVGTRLAKAALAAGRRVRVCSRSTGRLQPLAALGAEVKFLDAGQPKQFTSALNSMAGATIVYSIPPITGAAAGARDPHRPAGRVRHGHRLLDLLQLVRPLRQRARRRHMGRRGHARHSRSAMQNVYTDELEIERCTFDAAPHRAPARPGLRSGPRRAPAHAGRHVQDPRGGPARTSRIHVESPSRGVRRRGARRARRGYLVADDEPTTQGEYAKWLSDRLGVPMPPSRPMIEAGSRAAHRNRKIRNAKLKSGARHRAEVSLVPRGRESDRGRR